MRIKSKTEIECLNAMGDSINDYRNSSLTWKGLQIRLLSELTKLQEEVLNPKEGEPNAATQGQDDTEPIDFGG